MYREQIKVLDCTIRDGGLVNAHDFDIDFVRIDSGPQGRIGGPNAGGGIVDVELARWHPFAAGDLTHLLHALCKLCEKILIHHAHRSLIAFNCFRCAAVRSSWVPFL